MALQHLRSGTANKRPIPTAMSDGQLAVNTNLASPGLFFKDSNGDLVKAGPVHVGTTAPNASPASTAATALVANTVYQILTIGTSDFTAVGASANTVGVVFTATGTTTGTGTVSGQQGNEKGEQWLDTTNSLYVMKVYDGTGWRVTDSISLANGSAAAPSLHFGSDTNTGLFRSAADELAVTTGGAQRVTVDSSGNVGIGDTGPDFKLDVNGDIGIREDNNLVFHDGSGVPAFRIRGTSGNVLVFERASGNEEQMRIDDGKLLVGTSSDITSDVNYVIQSVATGGGSIALARNDGTVGVNERLGRITFYGNDGGSYEPVAQIECQADDPHALGDKPGRLVFSTTADGASSPTERMRIDSSGRVGIGTSSPSTPLHINGSANNTAITLSVGGTITGYVGPTGYLNGGSDSDLGYRVESGNNHIFMTGAAERLRIDSSGRLLVGASSSFKNSRLQVKSQFNTPNGVSLLHTQFSASESSNLNFLRSRDNFGGNSAVIDGSRLGQLNFGGYDGTDYESIGASIYSEVDGTPGSNDMPGRLVFSTTADGASNPTERMRIDSSGRVGMGATSPNSRLHVKDSNSGGDIGLRVQNSTSGANSTASIHLTTSTTQNFNSATIKTERTSGALIFQRESNERMRIDSSGRLLVGTTASIGSGDIQGVATNGAQISLGRNDSGSTVSSNQLGSLRFYGNHGGTYHDIGRIICSADANHSSTSKPTNLRFFTTSSGTTSTTERMRIDSSGNILFDCNDIPNGTSVYGSAFERTSSDRMELNMAASSTGGLYLIRFYNPNGNVGNIRTSGSGTSYEESSDYRLKENVVDITGAIDRVKQLSPRRFNFIADPTTIVDGFIAHEVQAFVPEAVSGEKDEVDEDGNPLMQGIDKSKLVPLLTAALQEAIAKIETLETEVASLRSK